jgi:tetratricopeptide (TPR) repeat protein
VRTRLGELQRASDGLDQLIAAGHRHPTVLYLDLWVKVRRGDNEAAAARYEQSADALGRILHSRSLASIAFLRLARRAVARRKVDDALKYFKEVRNLAVLADRVPEGLEDLPVAVGVEALLEGQVADAVDRFERAGDGAEQGSDRALAARLGSLLCRWWRRDGRLPVGFEEELAAVVDEVRAGLQGADPDDRDLQERRRLHRDLLLWQAMARLAGWQGRWVGRGVPADERERLGELLDELLRVDADMADPYLLEGLVGYAFGAPGPEHDRAVEALQQASDRGVSLPEVLTILEREQGRGGRAAGRVEEWLDAVRGYLSDPRTPEELRRRLQRQVAGLTRHTPLLREDLELAQFQVVPTLGDLHNRSQLLQRRVRRLFPPAAQGTGRDGAPDAERLMEPLQQATQLLGAAAQAFTTAELELLVLVGGLLLAGETIRD